MPFITDHRSRQRKHVVSTADRSTFICSKTLQVNTTHRCEIAGENSQFDTNITIIAIVSSISILIMVMLLIIAFVKFISKNINAGNRNSTPDQLKAHRYQENDISIKNTCLSRDVSDIDYKTTHAAQNIAKQRGTETPDQRVSCQHQASKLSNKENDEISIFEMSVIENQQEHTEQKITLQSRMKTPDQSVNHQCKASGMSTNEHDNISVVSMTDNKNAHESQTIVLRNKIVATDQLTSRENQAHEVSNNERIANLSKTDYLYPYAAPQMAQHTITETFDQQTLQQSKIREFHYNGYEEISDLSDTVNTNIELENNIAKLRQQRQTSDCLYNEYDEITDWSETVNSNAQTTQHKQLQNTNIDVNFSVGSKCSTGGYVGLNDITIPDHIYLSINEIPCDVVSITDEERSNYQHLSRMNIVECEETYQHTRLEKKQYLNMTE